MSSCRRLLLPLSAWPAAWKVAVAIDVEVSLSMVMGRIFYISGISACWMQLSNQSFILSVDCPLCNICLSWDVNCGSKFRYNFDLCSPRDKKRCTHSLAENKNINVSNRFANDVFIWGIPLLHRQTAQWLGFLSLICMIHGGRQRFITIFKANGDQFDGRSVPTWQMRTGSRVAIRAF